MWFIIPWFEDMKALLVIDMLEDFLEEGGALFCGKEARKIIPFIQEKINQARRERDLVIYICDAHREGDLEFGMFPKHCLEGTKGARIIKELKRQDADIVIKKARYSGLYGTDLEKILKEHQAEEVEIVGVCTSICVMDTVGSLRNRDYKVIVYKDGVADFDGEAHQFALKRMEKIYGAKVI